MGNTKILTFNVPGHLDCSFVKDAFMPIVDSIIHRHSSKSKGITPGESAVVRHHDDFISVKYNVVPRTNLFFKHTLDKVEAERLRNDLKQAFTEVLTSMIDETYPNEQILALDDCCEEFEKYKI